MSGVLPELTSEQRAEALEKAIEARRERAAAKDAIATGAVDPAGVLASPEGPYLKMRLFEFLTACTGIGPTTARKIIVALGVGEGRRLRGLGSRQRAALAEAVGAIGAGEPASMVIERVFHGRG